MSQITCHSCVLIQPQGRCNLLLACSHTPNAVISACRTRESGEKKTPERILPRHDCCTIYEQPYPFTLGGMRWFLPGAAGCKPAVTVSQTDDYIGTYVCSRTLTIRLRHAEWVLPATEPCQKKSLKISQCCAMPYFAAQSLKGSPAASMYQYKALDVTRPS